MTIFSDYEAQTERAFHDAEDAQEAVGYHQEMIAAVADWIGEGTFDEDEGGEARTIKMIEHRIYKDTDCGAWITFNEEGAPGCTVGTIVEGSDATFEASLAWPFSEQELREAIAYLEESVSEAWDEANLGDDDDTEPYE